jgi:hypothetical protein
MSDAVTVQNVSLKKHKGIINKASIKRAVRFIRKNRSGRSLRADAGQADHKKQPFGIAERLLTIPVTYGYPAEKVSKGKGLSRPQPCGELRYSSVRVLLCE